ncbi:MAG: HAMP domain-containing histidine kinase [Bacteroidales bacterium]|nr:HAMP domain-containing histidine kinase [Bacteroidales bacterium]
MPSPAAQRHHMSSQRRLLLAATLCVVAVAMGAAARLNGIAERSPRVAELEARIARRLEHNRVLAHELGLTLRNASPRMAHARALEFYSQQLQPAGVELLVFRHDSLLFWSSNIDLPPDTTDGPARLLRYSSCRFLAQSLKLGQGLYGLMLSRFYMDYPYQNDLLHNGLCAGYRCMEGYAPSRSQSYGAVPIEPQGMERFYMVPTDLARLSTMPAWVLWMQWAAALLLAVAMSIALSVKPIAKRPGLRLAATTLGLVGLRAISMWADVPATQGSRLFDPELFAHNALNPSLGDFFVNSLVAFTIIALLYNFTATRAVRWPLGQSCPAAFVAALAVWGIFGIADSSLVALVRHSTLPLEPIPMLNLNIYSGVAYLSMACWICGALLMLSAWVKLFVSGLGLRTALAVLLSSWGLGCGLLVLLPTSITWFGPALAALMATVMLVQRIRLPHRQGNGMFLVLVAMAAVYSAMVVLHCSRQKDDEIRQLLAIGLSTERDPLAELLLAQIGSRIQSDTTVAQHIAHIDQHGTDLYDHLRRGHFRDYLTRYDMRATVCTPGAEIWPDSADAPIACEQHFRDIIERYGTPLGASAFHFLNLQNGAVNYIGQMLFDGGRVQLFVELESRPSWEQLGYPELLMVGRSPKHKFYGHSYAKYHHGRLISQWGEFDYPLSTTGLHLPPGPRTRIVLNGYVHTVHSTSPDNLVLVSQQREHLLSITTSAVYSFVFYLVAMFALLRLSRWGVRLRCRGAKPSFKNRVKWAMGLIVVLSMLLVGIGTLLYSVRNFDHRIHKNLSEKLMSITLELYRDLPMLHDIDLHRDALQDKLIGLSNVFYTDINIYDTTGLLAITSRPEVFDRGLVGHRMDCQAWSEVHLGACAKFVGREAIGGAKFLSAYVPITSSGSRTIAYLNLPYFTKGEELTNELHSIVMAIVNIYTLMLMLAVAVAIVISEQITRPLALIRDKMRRVSISGRNDPIEYSGHDEVGQLVGEYNRMLMELDRSTRALAQSQRENAWREMARQVAHEVKNPLTPIKLSLQHLIRAKKAGAESWDALFDRFASSLNEQIDTLSRIASEFSTIAKLPVGQAAPIDMRRLLADVLNIFVGYADSHVRIALRDELPPEASSTVEANRDQLMRVFNNLIINAIQAIGAEQPGVVEVRLMACSSGDLRVEVIDSGAGISPEAMAKLFTPNFTTKTGGSGLGLAISKAIVETYNGKIGATGRPDKGATFWVELPTMG